MVIDIEPEPVSNGKIPFFHLHAGLDRFLPLHSLLDDLVDLVHIDPGLPDQVIETDQVPVPNLHRKDVRVHVLGLRRVVHWELEPIVETPQRSASPVSVRLLRLGSTDHSPHENIVRLHLHILEDAVVSRIDDHSEFVLIEGRRMDFVGRSTDPLFLFYEIDPGF